MGRTSGISARARRANLSFLYERFFPSQPIHTYPSIVIPLAPILCFILARWSTAFYFFC